MSSGPAPRGSSGNGRPDRSRSRLKLKHRPLVESLEGRQLLATFGYSDAIAAALKRAGLFAAHPLHELKKTVPKPAITAVVVSGPDATGAVTVAGRTYPRAKV